MKDDVYALIDFGSNTVTLSVYRMGYHDFRLLHKQKAALGIIRYIKDGILSEKGMRLAVDTLVELKHAAEPLTKSIYCFATASLRGVSNAQSVLGQIKWASDIDVDLLTGDQEAYYDYLGLMHYFPGIRNAVALDIGGGSMEIVHIRSGRLHQCISLPTGSLKLSIEYAGGRFPKQDECAKIEEGVRALLSAVEWLPHVMCGTIYTIGGTARAVSKLHKAIFNYSIDSNKGYSYPVSDLSPLLLYLEDENHYQRMKQIIPDRMQTIVPGMIALQAVAQIAGARTAVLSKYGVREGYLLGKALPAVKEHEQ